MRPNFAAQSVQLLKHWLCNMQSNIVASMFIAALLTMAKTRKQPKCPSTDEWIKTMWYANTVEYYSAIKKNKIMPFAAIRIQPEIIVLSKASPKEKDKYHMISLTCGV